MPRSRTMHLTAEEEETLRQMKADPAMPKRARQRAEILLLSAHHMSVADLAKYVLGSTQTVLDTFHRWWQGCRGELLNCDLEGHGAFPTIVLVSHGRLCPT
ncbi:helix-turn-helix domain-containing protein, partial [Candidatus Cyanaurora vandensis]|uniref:helix-turn-helix domain-containing protein n=1 Tax=Candidatus Cyanaurora vandensis TaxID=2714958 RepID=UPI00257C6015